MEHGFRPQGGQALAQLVQSLPAGAAIEFQTPLETPPQGLEALLQESNHRSG